MKTNTRWMALILLVSVLFYWKILLTQQFSILTMPEVVNQGYSWYQFCASTIQHGSLPLWDPFVHSGRSFVGGMETGAFYPLNLLPYLWPLNRSHMLSPQLYFDCHVLAHVLAAFFLFLLARELGLAPLAALAASLCFSLGGFVAKIAWPDMLNSAIWLPLVLLFLIRAWRAAVPKRMVLYSCFAGLALGMTILGGRIHIVIMDVAVVVSAAAYFAVTERKREKGIPLTQASWFRATAITVLIGAIALSFGAVQLFPTMEYSRTAIRSIGAEGPVPATERIPYSDLRDELWPRSLWGFLFITAFPGGSIGGESFTPYFGVLPLLLMIYGVWRNRQNPWVRYLAGLAVLSFFYTLGPYSLLHGLSYALLPYIWILRNAGRLIYLTHFALAILAGFGVQSLILQREGDGQALGRYCRTLMWWVIGISIAVGIPAVYGKPVINEWIYFSYLFMIAAYGLLVYVRRKGMTRGASFVLIAVILCDLEAGYWLIQPRVPLGKPGNDYLETLLYSRNLAEFLKRQPGLFRVSMPVEPWPNIGDACAVQIMEGKMATELTDFYRFRSTVPEALRFLNVRYLVRPVAWTDPDPLYSDSLWKVYPADSPPYPRAWIVHQAVVEPDFDRTLKRMKEDGFRPLESALSSDPLEAPLESSPVGVQEQAGFDAYQPNRLELTVRARSRGLLVLSEIYSPGWKAWVNGKAVPVHKVDGVLRGIVVPAGESKVVFRYVPWSVIVGAVFTCMSFLSVLALAIFVRRREKTVPAHRIDD